MHLILKALLTLSHYHHVPSLYDTEQDAGEDQGEYHYEGQSNACATDDARVLLQCHGGYIITSIIIRVIQRGPANAGFSLTLVYLFAAWQRHIALPVAEVVNAAALQPGLCFIPCSSYQFSLAIQPDSRSHLLTHCELYFFTEDIAKNSADENSHEQDKDENEIGEQEEFNLLYGTEVAQHSRDNSDEGHCGEDVHRPSEQIRPEQFIGVALLDYDP